MITAKPPSDWRALQSQVGSILAECGFEVETEKDVRLARGSVEVDVWAEESVKGRPYVILCECKHWAKRIPKTVVHAFRTVVADSGANIGYVIGSSGFQPGAGGAVNLTNVKLLTWDAFQQEFEDTWLDAYFVPFVTERFDRFLELVEPFPPAAYGSLSDKAKREFDELYARHAVLGAFLMQFTTYGRLLRSGSLPRPPFKEALPEPVRARIPEAVLDAPAYREFLEAAIGIADQAVRDFERVLASQER